MNPVIQAEHLQKKYGATVAVQDVSLQVQQGEIFGIIGPNGAGKTTTVEMLEGLRRADDGSVRVLGLDPQRDGDQLRERIGIQLQSSELDDAIKVWEALELFASFYRRTSDWKNLLAQWGLQEKRNASFKSLSGGQKQRLFIALALINDPEIVFLDELTTGLDPQARRETWEHVNRLRDAGKTVVLITHFMEEAEKLADRVALINHGRVIALDTPQNLIHSIGAGQRVRFNTANGFDVTQLQTLPNVTRVERVGKDIVVYGNGNGALLANIAVTLAQQNITPDDLRAEQATLEDVFIKLTKKELEG